MYLRFKLSQEKLKNSYNIEDKLFKISFDILLTRK